MSDQCGAHDVWQQAIDAGYENAADLRERMSPSCQRARRGRAASYPPDLPPAFNPKNMARTATDVLDNGLPALPEPLSYQMALPIARWKARHRAGSAHRREALAAGEALGDQGELAAAEATLENARQAAALIGNELIERGAELAQLHLRYVTNAAGGQGGVVERAQELIPLLEAASDNHGLARAWRLMTYVHWTASQSGKAAQAAERAIRYARQAGEEIMARQFSGALVISLLDGPTPVDEAAAMCEAMLPAMAEDRRALAVTEQKLAHLEAMRSNFDVARIRYRRSRELLKDFGYRFFAALTSLVSGPVEMLAGDLDAAERELRGDYETLHRMGERNYISSTAGMLAEVLYRQGRYQESAEFVSACKTIASEEDVPSQFLWRCVQAKLLARAAQQKRADELMAEATELIGGTDWLVWQGQGFVDLAEVRRLEGRTGEALDALEQALSYFTSKGNIAAAKQATDFARQLRAAS